jgi:hypothetical protein
VIRRLAVVALAVTLAAGAAACGEDDGATGVNSTVSGKDLSTTITVDPDTLPPPKALDLEPIYGDALAAIGMKLTDRGGLIDRSGGGYVASPTGQHLAMYVEPIGDRTMQEYLDGILDVAVIFSDLYDRWPGLQTYDVCQEPPDPDGNQDPEPLPVTQIELSRAQSDAIDWDHATVQSLIEGSQADPPALVLRVSSEMAAEPGYQALASEPTNDNNGGYP